MVVDVRILGWLNTEAELAAGTGRHSLARGRFTPVIGPGLSNFIASQRCIAGSPRKIWP
jgi:hypothetical protein